MIRQRKPLKRRPPPKRKAPPRRSNPERRAATFVKNFSGGIDHDGWIRAKPCCLCAPGGVVRAGDEGWPMQPVQAAHAIGRGMGGANSGWWLLNPLCNHHHREQEQLGNAGIKEKYGVDLVVEAKKYSRQHLEEIDAI